MLENSKHDDLISSVFKPQLPTCEPNTMASCGYRHLPSPRQRLLDCFWRSHLNDCFPLFQHRFYPIRAAPAESAVQADCPPRRAESRRTADCLCDAVNLIWNCGTRHDAGADGGLSGTVLVCAPGERMGGTLLAIYPLIGSPSKTRRF